MESRTVEPDSLDLSEEDGVSDALCEAVEEEIDFLEDREVKLVRMRADDDGEVFQVTIHAGDEMYRMSEVAPGHVSRTVFRDPEKDGAMPYQEDEEEEEVEETAEGEETDGEAEEGETDEKDEEESSEETVEEEGEGEETDGEAEKEDEKESEDEEESSEDGEEETDGTDESEETEEETSKEAGESEETEDGEAASEEDGSEEK